MSRWQVWPLVYILTACRVKLWWFGECAGRIALFAELRCAVSR